MDASPPCLRPASFSTGAPMRHGDDVCRELSRAEIAGARPALSSRAALIELGLLRKPAIAFALFGLSWLPALAGCGGEAKKEESPRAAKKPGLSKALLPRCGVGQFDKKTVAPVVQNGTKSWQLSYIVRPNAPQIAGLTRTMTVLETPPRPVKKGVVGARFVTIAGHRVSLLKANHQVPNNIAEWNTRS